ncbi:MAG: DUF4079 domain-containing protein [Cyanobacteriota bacterium]|nr:DUF4079 domain-containing protein [Cyanobacteriota bacterium]
MNLSIPESVKPWLNFFHPAIMFVLLGVCFYALYLGLKIRRTRSAEGEEKKQLIKGQFKDKHHKIGSLLLAFMVLATIGGMGVTYINNEKLFFGAHLLAGLGMTGLIAVSASLTPFMQKGKEWARSTHIGLNVILLGIFIWQAFTGVEILQRIIGDLF